MQVTTSSCTDLQTPAAIVALKTGIAALAEAVRFLLSTLEGEAHSWLDLAGTCGPNQQPGYDRLC